MVEQVLPHRLRSYIYTKLKDYFFPPPSSDDMTLMINRYSGSRMTENEVYDAVEIYLATIIKPSDKLLLVSKTRDQKTIRFANAKTDAITDTFDDIDLRWSCIRPIKRSSAAPNEDDDDEPQQPCFQLRFDGKHKEKVMESYLPHVFARAKDIKQEEKVLKLHSCGGDVGRGRRTVGLEHPATFETMAMDPEQKQKIIDDLNRFVKRRQLYKKVGKAWKRGYLLYGPPGTGKSSLIAAMANHVKFDVYDLELSMWKQKIGTRQSSFMANRFYRSSETKFTLSGLLNVIDGLWSCVGDERIIVFTTNHKDRLDPALLRPGRMDMHIHMSYCTASGFKTLASNYLDIHESNPHRLCGVIEGLIESTEITPAQVAEELMKE
ncbi:hypothetical protein M0R45_004126 [Rubus argutus]|uniref:AAA+ ATPase domain-containing protein n=1 Tax=Rubus argutus TaxID=59490 RepID=A0AAW1YIW2_RUBAR